MGLKKILKALTKLINSPQFHFLTKEQQTEFRDFVDKWNEKAKI